MSRGAGAKTGGRPVGVKNKNTAEFKAIAQNHGPASIAKIAHLALHAATETVQLAACREILDRAYGKATQHVHQTGVPRKVETNVGSMDAARRVMYLLETAAVEREKGGTPADAPAVAPTDTKTH